MTSDQQESSRPGPQQPSGPDLPGPIAPTAGEDGQLLLDEDGKPVMTPVTPPDGTAGGLPPATTRRTFTNPDGSVCEQVSIVYD